MAEDSETHKPSGGIERSYLLLVGAIISEFSAVIALPAVVFALIGKQLDAHFLTAPRFLLAGLALAFLGSASILVKRARMYAQKYQELIRRERDAASHDVH